MEAVQKSLLAPSGMLTSLEYMAEIHTVLTIVFTFTDSPCTRYPPATPCPHLPRYLAMRAGPTDLTQVRASAGTAGLVILLIVVIKFLTNGA